MGTIQEKVEYIGETKEAIKQAIIKQGVDVTDSDTFRSYADKIESIGSEDEENTPDPRLELTSDGVLQKKEFVFRSNAKEIATDALKYTFSNSKITSLNLGQVAKINTNGMNYACRECTLLRTVDLHSLTTINGNGCTSAFTGCTKLTDINLESLTTIYSSGLSSAFMETSITNLNFNSLTTLYNYALGYAFPYSKVSSLAFPALTSKSFPDNNKNCFSQMLYSVSGCTVHFPTNLESVIGTWSDVTSGFSGKNTTVLFDLPATE